jgi:uncharacterized membrane protein
MDEAILPIDTLASGARCQPGNTLTYASFGHDFMASYCLRCHSVTMVNPRMAPPMVNFDELSEIRRLAMTIDAQAGAGPLATREIMPPDDPKPTLEQRQMLAQWLACGAPSGM